MSPYHHPRITSHPAVSDGVQAAQSGGRGGGRTGGIWRGSRRFARSCRRQCSGTGRDGTFHSPSCLVVNVGCLFLDWGFRG